MKHLFITIILFIQWHIATGTYSKDVYIEIYHEEVADGYVIYADNHEYCPVSVQIKFELNNLIVAGGNEGIYIVPARTNGHRLTQLKVMDDAHGYSFRFSSLSNLGDHNQLEYDDDYNFSLPFAPGRGFYVMQGYDGKFSHQGQKMLDFSMPVGTEVMAARAGTVVRVVEKFKDNCPEISCAEFNNYVLIYHSDGTFAEYTHLDHQGVLVEEGQVVEDGEVIGYSGNTGWTTGPHLHFSVFLQRLTRRETLPTKFITAEVEIPQLLKEDNVYTRRE